MKPFPKRFIRKRKRGFALIATLTLMMLLTLLAVGILALASSQNRISLQTILQAEARQQALVGLDAAIGQLQVELGPDKRVSANSGILASSEGAGSQYLLGVWDSWDGPLYGKSASGKGGSIKETYGKGRSSMFRRWLISSRRPGDTQKLEGVEQLSSRRPGERICLVGEGTLGREYTARHYVYADLLTMPSIGNNKACFAWWVGGENQKAKITVSDPEETSNVMDVLHRTWNTPGPMFVDSKNLSFLPEKIEQPAKIVTLGTVPLVTSSSQSPGTPYFFDVTTNSYTLPINVRTGGFKQDLNLLLNKKNLKGTEFATRSNQDCPLADNEEIPQGTEQDMPIGSWQDLHAFYHCWPDGTAEDAKNFTARLLGDAEDAYTRMSGSAMDRQSQQIIDDPDRMSIDASNASYYGTRSMLEDGSSSAGYARTPVMLAFMNNFGLVTEVNEGTKTSDGEQGYKLSLCFAPMFLWWNPYNVPMKVRGQQLWAQSVPYKNTWIQTYCVQKAGSWDYDWSRYAMYQQQGDTGFGVDYGDYFQNSVNDTTGDILFEPGEIIFFSPGKARVSSDYNKRAQNPWITGYHPSNVAGYKARFYTMAKDKKSTDKGVASKHNLDAKKFYVRLRLGTYGGDGNWPVTQPPYQTDGYFFAPRSPEAITVMNGYNGIATTETGDTGLGKRAASPQRMLLGWYDPNDQNTDLTFCDESRNDSYWSADGTQNDGNQPYYIGAIGVVAKSGNKTVDSRIFQDKDFRTKLWQHSSPAFWGSSIINPSDQQRQYHPYQLAALDVSSGLNSSPMDNIGRNGILGITGDGEQVSFASVLELPVHPPFSLAGFAGMRLQPGWYDGSGGDAHRAYFRRMQYQAGVPGVGIGNSFADPCIPADDVYKLHQTNHSTELMPYNQGIFGDYYDHGLIINDALWDRWFCSSISDMPDRRGKKEAKTVLQDFLEGKEELPVARYKKANAAISNDDIVSRIMDGDGWKHIAQYLMIDGGFNVNSTSEEAWAAVLQGLARRKLVSNVGQKLELVENGKSSTQVLFSRFMVSTTDKSVDSLGGYSMLQGSSSFRRSNSAASAWGEVRKLEPEQIRELAKQMVKQVRLRGPFLNMSDFVNRRLETGSENALKGALQAAIDETDINEDFKEVMAARGNQGELFVYPEAEEGSIYTAAPGYLIQSDVLASLGNILTVRDDTFTVRAYGCVKSATNAILAQAWCEAVVQRTTEYVDPSNDPDEADYEPDGTKAKGLSKANKVLGRRFRVVSFKWLDAWDI